MKLLLDENLSLSLAGAVSESFPGSRHVKECGLEGKSDAEIWRYAREHGFAIASKDSDFYDLAVLHGSPPKVIWLRVGNASTTAIRDILRRLHPEIERFGEAEGADTLIVRRND